MQPDERDASYLWDMIQHASAVQRIIANRTLSDYHDDEDLRLLLERRIEIIGEAAKRISQAFQDTHPEIPWRKVIAQRNVLAHEYGDIDDEIMWDVATISVPQLIRLLDPLVRPLGDSL